MPITPYGIEIQSSITGARTFHNPTATSGTDSAGTNGTIYYGSIIVPGKALVAGIGFLIGSVGGTDKVIVSLHDITGALLANSAVAGITVSTLANAQEVNFTVPYTASGPDILLIGLTFNGTTAKFRTVPAFCGGGTLAGSGAQTFGTPAAFTVSGTRFTADKSPIAYLF